jgi:hypothetical protein
MTISPNADFKELEKILNENLLPPNSFVPHLDSIPNVKSKGIYFWFMHPDGYKALSNYVTIEPIEPKYTRNINGVKYDLVYIGTAGTGKKGNSNLSERFIWHIIEPHHTESNICHGTLSTLRAGLGALLSNDLILQNTENDVNDFMKQYMRVFWIEYPNDNDLIDNDEKILIKGLKPLLNLKNNPNARKNSKANYTQVYKIRRAEVYNNTRLRLGCKGESEKIRGKKNPNKDTTPIYNHQIIDENHNGCIEYFVMQNQHIGVVTRGIEGLPLGKSKITIYDSHNPNTEFTLWRRVTGNNNNHNAQNVYTYFDNTSTNNGPYRFLIIQDWMVNNVIYEITVRVCPII